MSKKRNKKNKPRPSPISDATLKAAAKFSEDYASGVYNSGSVTSSNTVVLPQGMSATNNSVNTKVYISSGTSYTNIIWPQSRTTEEEAEYQKLKKEYDLEVKEARKVAFTKLPRVEREAIIAAMELPQIAKTVKNQEVPKSQRFADLEAKGNNWNGITYSGFSMDYNWQPDIGLTLDEVKRAHADACFEEEVLNDKTSPVALVAS